MKRTIRDLLAVHSFFLHPDAASFQIHLFPFGAENAFSEANMVSDHEPEFQVLRQFDEKLSIEFRLLEAFARFAFG